MCVCVCVCVRVCVMLHQYMQPCFVVQLTMSPPLNSHQVHTVSVCVCGVTAVYLTLLLSLSTLSVLSSGVVMNMVHQDESRPIPSYLRSLLCCRIRQIKRRLNTQRRRRQVLHDQSFHNGDFVLTRKRCAPPDGSDPLGEGWKLLEDRNHHNTLTRSHPHSHVNHGVLNSEGGGGGGGGGGLEKENQLRAESSPLFDDVTTDDMDYDVWNYITWLDVGSTIDNILFWVFLIITVSSTVTVLLLFSY